jgi:hypothetical protein
MLASYLLFNLLKKEVLVMIDLIFAGILYLAIMFLVFFAISFITIGIAYVAAMFVRRCAHWINPSRLAFK